MACSPEVVEFMEKCYRAEEYKPRPLSFDLIDKVLTEVGKHKEVQANKKTFNNVLKFFKNGLIINLPQELEHYKTSVECFTTIDSIWELYQENTLPAEHRHNTFARWWVGAYNDNMNGFAIVNALGDDEPCYNDPRQGNIWAEHLYNNQGGFSEAELCEFS